MKAGATSANFGLKRGEGTGQLFCFEGGQIHTNSKTDVPILDPSLLDGQ